MKFIIVFMLIILSAGTAFAESPDCNGIEQWPTKMAFVHLKNAGITDNSKIDFAKTKVVRLSSEKINSNLYRQIHLIKFFEKSGKKIDVITVNDASDEECSMSSVEVFVISKHLGGE